MFDHIFENRDKKVTNLIKLSDYLGRALRENIEIFSIDDTERKVTYITESGKIIAGTYDFEEELGLSNIQVESEGIFEDNEQFDEFVDFKITDFIQNIFVEDFTEADTSFNKVLQLWESRVKFSSVKKKLFEKSQKFNGSNRIIETPEFQKLVEVAPGIVSFLKENKNIINIPEISNMIKLSSSVSEAFNTPRLTYDSLEENGFVIPPKVNHTVYDMICKQELVRKELVESKNSFDLVWLNNEKISDLASLLYEKDDALIARGLVEAICEIPYLALATKRQISETLMNNLELNESISISVKDVKSFSSRLFEYKKPLKQLFVSMLNEKYGILVQNLKDIPTFKSLLNTQVLIFEALAKLSPRGSVLKEVLQENSQMLKTKNGVESIDVNYFIELLFEKAEYTEVVDKSTIYEDLSIKETFSNLESIEDLVNLVCEGQATKKAPKAPKAKEVVEPEKEEDSEEASADTEEEEAEAKDSAPTEEVPKEEEKEEKEKEKQDIPTSDEIMSNFKNFEDILNSIDFEDLDPSDSEEEDETATSEVDEVDTKEEDSE